MWNQLWHIIPKDISKIEYVIYCRRSSKEWTNRQESSIPQQIDQCIKFAKNYDPRLSIKEKPENFEFETEEELRKENNASNKEDRKIYKKTRKYFIVKEKASWKTPWWRTKRNRLMELVETWEIQWIISYSPDRQARNMVDWWRIIHYAHEERVDLKYANFSFENNAGWRMMLWVWFVFSKQYSDKLSEDIIRWNTAKFQAWLALWKQKIWYFINKKGYLEPHPQYFHKIRQAFEYKIYEGWTDKQICDWLRKNEVKRELVSKKWEYKEGYISISSLRETRWKSINYWVDIWAMWEVDLREKNEYFEPLINWDEYWDLQMILSQQGRWKSKKVDADLLLKPLPENNIFLVDWTWKTISRYHTKRWVHESKYKQYIAEWNDIEYNEFYDVKRSWFRNPNISFTYTILEKAIIKKLKQFKVSEEDYHQFAIAATETIRQLEQQRIAEKRIYVARYWAIKSKYLSYRQNTLPNIKNQKDRDAYEMKIAEFESWIAYYEKELESKDRKLSRKITSLESFILWMNNIDNYFLNWTPSEKAQILAHLFKQIRTSKDKKFRITVHNHLRKFFK